MHTPFFSIIMPTYNRAHLLSRAIRSVVEQSFSDWELLVVDDGSEDLTSDLVASWLRRSPRIRYLQQSHQGVSHARNHAIAQSAGRYIAFLDSDDEYIPRHLELHYQYLLDHSDIDVMYGKVEVVGDPYVPDMLDLSRKIHVRDCIQIGTFFIERKLLLQVGGFPIVKFGEDYELFQVLKTIKARIAESPFVSYRYYRTEVDSICNRQMNQKK